LVGGCLGGLVGNSCLCLCVRVCRGRDSGGRCTFGKARQRECGGGGGVEAVSVWLLFPAWDRLGGGGVEAICSCGALLELELRNLGLS
jgi:hypothetical protein